ncbi:MAG: hypothetical protein IJ587_03090 [Synergistaceae bacterium]|nr:hypothetical protein [Synergistaceae bacterium]
MKRTKIRDSVKEALKEPDRALDLLMEIYDKLYWEVEIKLHEAEVKKNDYTRLAEELRE